MCWTICFVVKLLSECIYKQIHTNPWRKLKIDAIRSFRIPCFTWNASFSLGCEIRIKQIRILVERPCREHPFSSESHRHLSSQGDSSNTQSLNYIHISVFLSLKVSFFLVVDSSWNPSTQVQISSIRGYSSLNQLLWEEGRLWKFPLLPSSEELRRARCPLICQPRSLVHHQGAVVTGRAQRTEWGSLGCWNSGEY